MGLCSISAAFVVLVPLASLLLLLVPAHQRRLRAQRNEGMHRLFDGFVREPGGASHVIDGVPVDVRWDDSTYEVTVRASGLPDGFTIAETYRYPTEGAPVRLVFDGDVEAWRWMVPEVRQRLKYLYERGLVWTEGDTLVLLHQRGGKGRALPLVESMAALVADLRRLGSPTLSDALPVLPAYRQLQVLRHARQDAAEDADDMAHPPRRR